MHSLKLASPIRRRTYQMPSLPNMVECGSNTSLNKLLLKYISDTNNVSMYAYMYLFSFRKREGNERCTALVQCMPGLRPRGMGHEKGQFFFVDRPQPIIDDTSPKTLSHLCIQAHTVVTQMRNTAHIRMMFPLSNMAYTTLSEHWRCERHRCTLGWSKNPNFIQLSLHNHNFIPPLTKHISAKFYYDRSLFSGRSSYRLFYYHT